MPLRCKRYYIIFLHQKRKKNVSDIFPLKPQNRYNLRNNSEFLVPNVKSVNNGFESLRYLGPKLWEKIPSNFKALDSLDKFKTVLKGWKPDICKLYLNNSDSIEN